MTPIGNGTNQDHINRTCYTIIYYGEHLTAILEKKASE